MHKSMQSLKLWYMAAILLQLSFIDKKSNLNFTCKWTTVISNKQAYPDLILVLLCLKENLKCGRRGAADAFNMKGSCCRFPNCVQSCQLLFVIACLLSNHPADKDIFWFIGKQLVSSLQPREEFFACVFTCLCMSGSDWRCYVWVC